MEGRLAERVIQESRVLSDMEDGTYVPPSEQKMKLETDLTSDRRGERRTSRWKGKPR